MEENGSKKADSANRFNNRVKNYSLYRPDYPSFLFPFLEHELGLQKNMTLADIGSGTGLFSTHLLERGYNLIGVEPNVEMRAYAAFHLSRYSNFTSLPGTAENTGLPASSIDCIFVAQAFHWLNAAEAKKEFVRILKPGGSLVICWILAKQNSPFLKEYEELRKQFGINYKAEKRNDEDVLKKFYEPLEMEKKVFEFSKLFNFESLKGLLDSISFMPHHDDPQYAEMEKTLSTIFNKFNVDGYVEMEYELIVYWNKKT